MAKQYNLGKVEKIELRDVWPHEALDFTKWLAESENLAMLGEAIDIELELVETESAVGAFSVDIFADEVGTGRRVIIENQLEETNHDHLGKIITYAAGKNAEVVVWVVAHARDEHKQAVEWLNQHTDSEFGFFLVEVELWTIGESLPAPVFNVMERPNEWAKSVKLREGLTETEQVKLSYWTKYVELARGNAEFMKRFNPRKPSKDHWTTLGCGSSSYHISLLIDTQLKRIGVEFCVPDNKEIGAKATENKGLFEEAVGLPAIVVDAKKASGLRFYKDGCDVKGKQDKWPAFIAQQLEWALAMRKVIDDIGL